ncbi:MAG: efflux RND transporter periplasmic adaptor subunit [Acidobacteria bacterium]|nr:efflux RND transporter periplasmic adaptor subunit [Acidobacteriota bacterium]MBV9145562.1 efflux RND transporter periplasmic adaptor subunit [Acidobacteriota bacterium]
MPLETKYGDLSSLRIDRAQKEPDEPKWSKRFILAGIFALVVLSLVALGIRLFSSSIPEVQTVRAQTISSSTPGDTVLQAAGYIVAHHTIDVNSKVTGRIAWIGVEKGDKVKAGQVLVKLEDQEFRAQVQQARGAVDVAKARLEQLQHGSRPEEIDQANANLDEARANLADAKSTLERTKPLVQQGVFSHQQLDDAQAKYDSALQHMQSLEKAYRLSRIGPRQEEIESARGAVEQAEGQLAYAESQLDATQIRAPVTGTILERTAEKGELVTAQFAAAADTGGPRGSVVTLADLTDLQVELDISQNDFAKLSPTQKAVLSTDAYPDREYKGVINEIAPMANRQKATVQVKVKVLNPDDYLRPEENANVRFLADENKHAPSAAASAGAIVPISAVHDSSGKRIVLVAFKGRAVAREIKVISQRSDGYVVDGLTGGEDVIVNAPSELKDGDRVKVK